MRHGKDKVFSVKGILVAINYWKKNGHEIVGFVPDYLTNWEQVKGKEKAQAMGYKMNKAQIPDDMTLMSQLKDEGYLITTPSQDYDDSYCIQYAKKLNAFIVTNDKFRDYIDSLFESLEQDSTPQSSNKKPKNSLPALVDKSQAKNEQAWLRNHSVSYTFKKDEFLPNPDSQIWHVKGCVFADYKNYPV